MAEGSPPRMRSTRLGQSEALGTPGSRDDVEAVVAITLFLSHRKIRAPILRTGTPIAGAQHFQLRGAQRFGGGKAAGAQITVKHGKERSTFVGNRPVAADYVVRAGGKPCTVEPQQASARQNRPCGRMAATEDDQLCADMPASD